MPQNLDRKIKKRQKIDSSELLILNMINFRRNNPNLVQRPNQHLRADPYQQ